MTKLRHLEESARRVLEILKIYPECRDNNWALLWRVWQEDYLNIEPGIHAYKNNPLKWISSEIFLSGKLTPPETVFRARRKVQEIFPDLRGSRDRERQKESREIQEGIKGMDLSNDQQFLSHKFMGAINPGLPCFIRSDDPELQLRRSMAPFHAAYVKNLRTGDFKYRVIDGRTGYAYLEKEWHRIIQDGGIKYAEWAGDIYMIHFSNAPFTPPWLQKVQERKIRKDPDPGPGEDGQLTMEGMS